MLTTCNGRWALALRPVGPGSDKSRWTIIDGHNHPIAESPVGPHAFNEANGWLLKAAPQLLAALEALMDRYGPDATAPDIMAARAAIKAARGE